jgi:hypothetical protein
MKTRAAFVANSSSSSFLIVGRSFDRGEEELAEEFRKKLEPFQTHEWQDGNHGDKFEEGGTTIGIDFGGFDEDTSCIDAEAFVVKLTDAITKCKAAGIEHPEIIAGCSRG